jgi:hypothetical protein
VRTALGDRSCLILESRLVAEFVKRQLLGSPRELGSRKGVVNTRPDYVCSFLALGLKHKYLAKRRPVVYAVCCYSMPVVIPPFELAYVTSSCSQLKV